MLCLEGGSGRGCKRVHSTNSSALEGLVGRGEIVQDSPGGGGVSREEGVVAVNPLRVALTLSLYIPSTENIQKLYCTLHACVCVCVCVCTALDHTHAR